VLVQCRKCIHDRPRLGQLKADCHGMNQTVLRRCEIYEEFEDGRVQCASCAHKRPVLAGPLREMVHCARQQRAAYFNPTWWRECDLYERSSK